MQHGSKRAERIGTNVDIVGESPVWCGETGRLWWVDIRAPALRRLDPSTGALASFAMPDLCGAVMLTRDERVLVSLRLGVFVFDPRTSTLAPLCAPEPPSLDNRLNESKCDRRGRLWVSTMRDFGLAASGALYRIDARLACARMLGEITVPNAIAWSPDDRTMYFADTRDGRLRAYDFDADAGTLGAMRVLNADGIAGRPDGAAVDAEGGVWSARYGGGIVARILPDGRVDRIVAIPATQVTSCAFGGAGLRTLFITTARQKLTAEELAAQPAAGGLFAVDAGVAGLPEPRFTIPAAAGLA
jgi:sugar lactone lactonase YvrE